VRSFKRLITPAGKPQGFGFAEYDDLGAAQRALKLLNGIELPALEEAAESRKLLVRLALFLGDFYADFTPLDQGGRACSRCLELI